MPSIQLYDQLLQFPVFQGMSHEDLLKVVAYTRFDFVKISERENLIHNGDECNKLYFITSGTVKQTMYADNKKYLIEEYLQAPCVIQPERLFGLNLQYSVEVTAITNLNCFAISKEEIRNLSNNLMVFRINLLNIYATLAQKYQRYIWQPPAEGLPQRLIRFFVSHCSYPAGKKEFHILMERLADEMNDSRLDVSRALNQLQTDGFITLSRGVIHINALEKLIKR
jgi:CRP-like cAMP-binding protein